MSSASRPSDAAVNPTRSANSTETSRRSACDRAAFADVWPAGVASDPPHSPQNLAPGAFEVPQDAHARVSGAPHSPQNLRFPSFGSPQAAQSTEATIALSPIRGTSATRTLGS